MSGYLFALALCVIVVLFLVQLLRRRWIREKYAIIWILVAVGIAAFGAFPGLAVRVSRLVGVEVPANLVFAIAIVTLLAVCIQLSVGVSQLDERVRTLAEEVAILRLEAQQHTAPTIRPQNLGPGEPTRVADAAASADGSPTPGGGA